MVVVLLCLTLLAIIVPALVMSIKTEAKNTVSEKLKTTSLHLAEVGQDRGAWKIRESDDVWETILADDPISGYDNDVEHEDVDGGVYKIDLSSGPGDDQVTVVSKGKANGSDQIRIIEAIYTKGVTLGAMSCSGAIDYKPNLVVHWGPVVSYTSIDKEPDQRYPRKFSAGQIVGYDTVNDNNNGALPGDNWSTYDYVAFYDMGVEPEIILDNYRQAAKDSVIPPLRRKTGSSEAAHDTSQGWDSGYYTEDIKIEEPGTGQTDYIFECSTCVIFVEGNISQFANGSYLNIRALLATGNVDYNSRTQVFTATVPASASDEYQHSSLQSPNYFSTTMGWTDGGTTNLADIGYHGFLYAGGNLTNAGGGACMVGAIFVGGSISVNQITVYYDESVAEDVEMGEMPITRSSWDEITGSW